MSLEDGIRRLIDNCQELIDYLDESIQDAGRDFNFEAIGRCVTLRGIHEQYMNAMQHMLSIREAQQPQPQPAANEQPVDAGGSDNNPTPEYVEARRFVNFLSSIDIVASREYLGGVLVRVHHYDGLHFPCCSGHEIGPKDKVSISEAISIAIGRALERIGRPEER